MKDLIDIAKEDITGKFTGVYKEINELREYLDKRYHIREDEITKYSGGDVGLVDTLGILNDIETAIRKIISNYKKK